MKFNSANPLRSERRLIRNGEGTKSRVVELNAHTSTSTHARCWQRRLSSGGVVEPCPQERASTVAGQLLASVCVRSNVETVVHLLQLGVICRVALPFAA